ncbi:hypothetical protein [Roseovarius sp. THAF9]|uniref:hypothetical protein n=1 Tax=Roseovarius sp. THAF9 TaxID=2587847 RepID=UPI001C129A3F|nr:hypothetical protein [Roseovarius sp. THAF9]
MKPFSTFLTLALALCLFTAEAASAQDNPVQAARAAGLYGITPDLSRQTGNARAQEGQEIAWTRFGIHFEEYNNRAFVAALKPGGAAASQGAKVGDVLRGTDIMGGSAGLTGVLQAFASAASRDTPSVLLYVFDTDSGWQREYRLTAAAPDGTVVSIPPALRGAATSHAGLMAILRADPGFADPADIAYDAMLALQAISKHVKACYGPNAVAIPVQITTTTTTRDGFGIIKDTETDQYGELLRVRPEFASWARSNLRIYQTQPISTVRSAVLELISQQGCDGEGVRQLEAGLAKVMNVALPEPAPAPQTGGIPDTADAFIAQCYPLMIQRMQSKGHMASERSTAQICLCQEHAARALDDAALYASLKNADDSYYIANPDLHGRFDRSFMECFRAPEGSALRDRVEALWREMNI